MSLAAAKQGLLEQFARVGKAVASPARLKLLDLLAQGEKPVETLARQADLSLTNASNHLGVLRGASLVATRREGTQVHYRLADPGVHAFLRALQDVAHRRLAEVRQIVGESFRDPEGLEPVDAAGLLARMQEGEVVVVDVRPADEYASGHIPGALSFPAEEVERRLGELPRGKDVVAYCRGPYCVLAVGAVRLLRGRGFRARRLEEGVPDWLALGLEVATGPTAAGG